MTDTKTTSKTKTKAEQTRQDYADAIENLNTLKLELQGVLAGIEATTRAWERGDSTVPASRMVELKFEEQRLTALVAAAERQAKAAERRILTDETELAKAVAKALGTEIFGLEPQVSSERPNDSDEPALHVVQDKPNETDIYRGTIKGQCSLYVTGPEYMAAVDTTQIRRALKESDVRLHESMWDLNIQKIGNTQVIDLRIELAYAETPVLATNPGEYITSEVGQTVAAQVVRNNWSPSEGESHIAAGGKSSLVSCNVDNKGIRTTEIEVKIYAGTTEGSWLSIEQVHERVTQHIERMQGMAMADLGRVATSKVLSVEPSTNYVNKPIRVVTARLSFKSQRPSD